MCSLVKALGGAFFALLLVFINPANGLFVSSPCCHSFAHAGALFGPRLQFSSPGLRGILKKASGSTCSGM